MEDSADQLDFNDELETLETKEESWWRTLFHQICQVEPPGFFSHQTTCANMIAWSVFTREHAYKDLLLVLDLEELPVSTSAEKLKILVESNSVYQWVDQQSEISTDAENPWGDLELIRCVAERCAAAEKLVWYLIN